MLFEKENVNMILIFALSLASEIDWTGLDESYPTLREIFSKKVSEEMKALHPPDTEAVRKLREIIKPLGETTGFNILNKYMRKTTEELEKDRKQYAEAVLDQFPTKSGFYQFIQELENANLANEQQMKILFHSRAQKHPDEKEELESLLKSIIDNNKTKWKESKQNTDAIRRKVYASMRQEFGDSSELQGIGEQMRVLPATKKESYLVTT